MGTIAPYREKPQGDVVFNGLQQDYNAARPGYPEAVLKFIHARCPEAGSIVDVGCGTGILTRQLATPYEHSKIWGFDINANMIKVAHAGRDVNISYCICRAEALPVAEDAVDLLTVAQAVHWFNRPTFFAEARRVIAADGLLCLIENNRNWRENQFLDAYEELLEGTSPGYSRHYRAFDYPAELDSAGYLRIVEHKVRWRRNMSPREFVQMTHSSTRYQTALRNRPNATEHRLRELLSCSVGPDGLIVLDYETRLIVARPQARA